MDESGIEPETSPMLRERATNYATRPNVAPKRSVVSGTTLRSNIIKLYFMTIRSGFDKP